MAVPLAFQPAQVDPHLELERRLRAAPREHAEALLVAYDILQEAHNQGLLDAVHGLVGAKDTVFAKIAEYAKLPEGINGIRNLLVALKVFTALDPEVVEHLVKTTTEAARQESKPASLFEITRRTFGADGRRGLSFLTLILTGLGRSLKR